MASSMSPQRRRQVPTTPWLPTSPTKAAASHHSTPHATLDQYLKQHEMQRRGRFRSPPPPALQSSLGPGAAAARRIVSEQDAVRALRRQHADTLSQLMTVSVVQNASADAAVIADVQRASRQWRAAGTNAANTAQSIYGTFDASASILAAYPPSQQQQKQQSWGGGRSATPGGAMSPPPPPPPVPPPAPPPPPLVIPRSPLQTGSRSPSRLSPTKRSLPPWSRPTVSTHVRPFGAGSPSHHHHHNNWSPMVSVARDELLDEGISGVFLVNHTLDAVPLATTTGDGGSLHVQRGQYGVESFGAPAVPPLPPLPPRWVGSPVVSRASPMNGRGDRSAQNGSSDLDNDNESVAWTIGDAVDQFRAEVGLADLMPVATADLHSALASSPLAPSPPTPAEEEDTVHYYSGYFTATATDRLAPLVGGRTPGDDDPPVKVRIPASVAARLQAGSKMKVVVHSRTTFDDQESMALNRHLHAGCRPNLYAGRTRMNSTSMALRANVQPAVAAARWRPRDAFDTVGSKAWTTRLGG
ncbi:hypothetical protein BC828DRAFT_404511 [Blastocladiella britannica]|nr:hypothetical protein BC828DRAFT_404511 [Blastocladiella britannica]